MFESSADNIVSYKMLNRIHIHKVISIAPSKCVIFFPVFFPLSQHGIRRFLKKEKTEMVDHIACGFLITLKIPVSRPTHVRWRTQE
jgi:hypothetical protein